MALNLELHGIHLEFEIRNYKRSDPNDRFSSWCDVDFRICSEKWLDYHIDGELLMNDEVDEILAGIDKLLVADVGEPFTWECMEPDFRFAFHPKRDLTKDPSYTFVAPGHEIEDIKLEWSVYFWNGHLTENRITLVLSRADIIQFQQYLHSVLYSSSGDEEK